MLTLSSYIKTLKKYANNISISDDEFFRAVFGYITEKLNIRNKNNTNEYYDFTKSRISGILTQKEDVPSAIRTAVSHYSSKKKVIEVFPDFLEDYMNPSKIEAAVEDIKELIVSDYSFSQKASRDICSLDNSEFLATAFIEAVKSNNLRVQKIKELWRCGNNTIKLISGDLIKIAFENTLTERRIVVIPVNTAFDTQLSTNAEEDLFPLVSEKTIHGQWLTRILQVIDKNELDCRIQKHLRVSGAMPIATSRGIGGKADKYSIGTTVAIQEKNTIFYLLAVSDFDDRNVARSSRELIKNAIEKLLDYYDELGLGYEIYIPLLGTGKSRAHLTPKESMQLIKDTLVEQHLKINGHIYIVALEDTILELS